MNGSKKLPLVSADLGRVDASVAWYQPSVLVDEPCLSEHVGGGILHLHATSKCTGQVLICFKRITITVIYQGVSLIYGGMGAMVHRSKRNLILRINKVSWVNLVAARPLLVDCTRRNAILVFHSVHVEVVRHYSH